MTTSALPAIEARAGRSCVAQAMLPTARNRQLRTPSMTENGRRAVRRWFLLESVYKGGRRLAMVLAEHPFETVLEIRLVEFAQDASDQIAIRIEECCRRNHFAQLQLLHLIGSSAYQQRKRDFVLLGKWLYQGLTLLVIH